MKARWPRVSSRASTLIHSSMNLPVDGLVREAKPAIHSGWVGVMLARAVPAFHRG